MSGWHVSSTDGKLELGPFTGVQLIELVKTHRITPETLVRHPAVTKDTKVTASTIPQLKAAFATMLPEQHPEDAIIEGGINMLKSAASTMRAMIPKRKEKPQPKPKPKVISLKQIDKPAQKAVAQPSQVVFLPTVPPPEPIQPLVQTIHVHQSSMDRPIGFRCPYCQSPLPPRRCTKTSVGGWIFFWVLLLFMCFPLCWIGLLIRDEYTVCSSCRMKLG